MKPKLRVGDRIRVVRLPSCWSNPGWTVPRETRLVFKRLIARRRSLRIYKIDSQGQPWIHCRFRRSNGTWAYHWLFIETDAWTKVHRRV